MRILLINPPFYRFIGLEQDYVPLSLLAVGSKMAENGHMVYLKNFEIGKELTYKGYHERGIGYDKYIDALTSDHYIWDEVKYVINQVEPDMIGINVLTVKYGSVIKIIRSTWGKDIRVVVGGHHVMTGDWFPPGVEVFSGEYESMGDRLKDLDELPFPNYDILMDNYSPDGYAHIMTSRGCPYSCRFCASFIMWQRRVTYKSAERIIREMQYIYNRYKPDCFTIWDEVFTLHKKRLSEFCKGYNVPASWRCDSRADLLDREKLEMMITSGCKQISIGIESGDDGILNMIGKGEDINDYKRAAEVLNFYDMQWKAYCIIGFPYDTEETVFKTIEFIKSLKPSRITISFFTPYKGTEMYDEMIGSKAIKNGYNTSIYSHQSPYNYFCRKIPYERYKTICEEITADIDNYNSQILKTWK